MQTNKINKIIVNFRWCSQIKTELVLNHKYGIYGKCLLWWKKFIFGVAMAKRNSEILGLSSNRERLTQ